MVTSFLAVCGECRWCTSGMEYLCEVYPDTTTAPSRRLPTCAGEVLAPINSSINVWRADAKRPSTRRSKDCPRDGVGMSAVAR